MDRKMARSLGAGSSRFLLPNVLKYGIVYFMYRTLRCGEVRPLHAGSTHTLSGWVNRRRDHGGVVFLDLRDRTGITQVTFRQEVSKAAWELANTARAEDVMKVRGIVERRPSAMVNEKIPTGVVELSVQEVEFLSRAKTPPFEVVLDANQSGSRSSTREELRMTYRYLDFRSGRPYRNLVARHQVIAHIRNFLMQHGFIEVDTPMLTKSTPEGARDYLVPSRLHPGSFYALPQSPQQFKQLLMVGGIERYFQIARCLRDEDARGDRQAEFTQLDLEMSFVDQKEILDLIEELFTGMVREFFPHKRVAKSPWPRLSYEQAMAKYGSDKPDLRFGLEIEDVSSLLGDTAFAPFRSALENSGVIRAILAPAGREKLSRSSLGQLAAAAKAEGLPALGEIFLDADGVHSPLEKHLGQQTLQGVVQRLGGEVGDLVLLAAGPARTVASALGSVRTQLAHLLSLVPEDVLAFAYIVDFPLFEPDKVEGHFAPSHHMFTAPKEEDYSLLETMPERVRSYQHDLALNGYEIAGGSIRIHDRKIQEKIFDLIGFSSERKKFFTHMLEAFEYGVPPHGGIAPGIDRFLAILLDEPNIREVIPFPKTGDGRDLLMGAPAAVESEQLRELHIKIARS